MKGINRHNFREPTAEEIEQLIREQLPTMPEKHCRRGEGSAPRERRRGSIRIVRERTRKMIK